MLKSALLSDKFRPKFLITTLAEDQNRFESICQPKGEPNHGF